MICCGVEIKAGQEWLNLEGLKFEVVKDVGRDLYKIRINDLNLETIYHVSLFIEFVG